MPEFYGLCEITLLSVAVRLLLATVCGGLVGIEREYKRRPAGFRTHILICLGACMTTLTSQYLFCVIHAYTDIARLGAQVIAGIGFIGAGTIIVTRRQRVKGLTTAAGLWVSAIIGLAVGSGFYIGALYTTGLVLLAELLFSKLEYRIMDNAPEINLYIEYTNRKCLEEVLKNLQEKNLRVLNLEITRAAGDEKLGACAIFRLRLNKRYTVSGVLSGIAMMQGVISVEEI